MVRVAQVLSLLAVTAVLAGCGGSDEDEPTTAATGASTATVATTAGPATTATAPVATTTAGPSTTTTPTGGAATYAAVYERECKKLFELGTTYGKTFSGPRPSLAERRKLVPLYKRRTIELLEQLRSMFRTLGAAVPPAEFAEFQRSIVAIVPQVDLKVDRALRVVRGIRSVEQAPSAGDEVKRALSSIDTEAFPAALQRQAPSCGRFG